MEALLRASQIAQTAPKGPVYVNLEVEMQEKQIEAMPTIPDVRRYPVPRATLPAPDLVATAAKLLSEAKRRSQRAVAREAGGMAGSVSHLPK